MILQRYEFRLRDANKNEHDVCATGNTAEAAAHVVALYAGQKWATPIELLAARPVND